MAAVKSIREKKEPFVRITKRSGLPHWKAWGIRVIIGNLAIAVLRRSYISDSAIDPVKGLRDYVRGAFSTSRRAWVTLETR
jgi:simple sugar transport system permease protein